MEDLVGLNKLNKDNGGLGSKEIIFNPNKAASKSVCNPNRAVVENDQVVGRESFESFELLEFQVSPKNSKRKERKFGSLFSLQDKGGSRGVDCYSKKGTTSSDHLGDLWDSVLDNEVSILEVEGLKVVGEVEFLVAVSQIRREDANYLNSNLVSSFIKPRGAGLFGYLQRVEVLALGMEMSVVVGLYL
ncbi:hypothetical protein V6N13_035796 [Hibiscus sabdariffa]